jgi:hypothetical protein
MENSAGIVLKNARESGLVISRVPKTTKDLFIAVADGEFCSDYGLLLKHLLDQTLEYQEMKRLLFNGLHDKLDAILDKIEPKEEKNEDGTKTIQLMNGKTINKTMKGGNV